MFETMDHNYVYQYANKAATKTILEALENSYDEYPCIRLEFGDQSKYIIVAKKYEIHYGKAMVDQPNINDICKLDNWRDEMDRLWDQYDKDMTDAYKKSKHIGYHIETISHNICHRYNFQLCKIYNIDEILDIIDTINKHFISCF